MEYLWIKTPHIHIVGDELKKIHNKSKRILRVEQTKGVEIEEELRRLFVDENKSTEEIANYLSISYVSAFRWLQRAGIYSRKLKL